MLNTEQLFTLLLREPMSRDSQQAVIHLKDILKFQTIQLNNREAKIKELELKLTAAETKNNDDHKREVEYLNKRIQKLTQKKKEDDIS